MMKLKLSLKNAVRPGLLFNLLLILFFLGGCQVPNEPTYREKDIPDIVKKICRDEYRLNVTTQRTGNTLWIYAPVEKILSKDYGIKEDKILDEALSEKLRNILVTCGRVLVSSDNTPEFYGLVAADINLGLDYIIIGNVLDIKKSYADFIPWPEANRRYVMKIQPEAAAIGDTGGRHLKPVEIKLQDFLAAQMAQRIGAHFQDENLKPYFNITKSEGKFADNNFIIEYAIEETANPKRKIDMKKDILDIITYCIKTYEFKDFSLVEIKDLLTQDTTVFSKKSIWGRASE
jgi:hypothetical protein